MCTDGHTLYQGGTWSSARTIGTSRRTMRRLSRSPSRVISGVTSVRMPLTRSVRPLGWSTRTCTTSAGRAERQLIVVCEAAFEDRVGAVQCVGDVDRVADAHVVEHHQQRLRAGERALLEAFFAAQQLDARTAQAVLPHAVAPQRGLVQRERLVRRVEMKLGLRDLGQRRALGGHQPRAHVLLLFARCVEPRLHVGQQHAVARSLRRSGRRLDRRVDIDHPRRCRRDAVAPLTKGTEAAAGVAVGCATVCRRCGFGFVGLFVLPRRARAQRNERNHGQRATDEKEDGELLQACGSVVTCAALSERLPVGRSPDAGGNGNGAAARSGSTVSAITG